VLPSSSGVVIPIMEAVSSSEIYVNFYQTTQRHFTEDRNLPYHLRDNKISQIISVARESCL